MPFVKYGGGFVYTAFAIYCGTYCMKHGVMAVLDFSKCSSGNNGSMYWTSLHLSQLQLQCFPFIKTQNKSIKTLLCVLRDFPP